MCLVQHLEIRSWTYSTACNGSRASDIACAPAGTRGILTSSTDRQGSVMLPCNKPLKLLFEPVTRLATRNRPVASSMRFRSALKSGGAICLLPMTG